MKEKNKSTNTASKTALSSHGFTLFQDSRKEDAIEIVKDALKAAFRRLHASYGVELAAVKIYYVSALFVESVKSLVEYFRKTHPEKATYTGDEAFLKSLEVLLGSDEKVRLETTAINNPLAADVLAQIKNGLPTLQPGFFGYGEVYLSFSFLLCSSYFESSYLWRSDGKRIQLLEQKTLDSQREQAHAEAALKESQAMNEQQRELVSQTKSDYKASSMEALSAVMGSMK